MKELVDFSEEGEEAIFKSIFSKRDLCYLGTEVKARRGSRSRSGSEKQNFQKLPVWKRFGSVIYIY